MAFGKKRSKVLIEEIKNKILELVAVGLTRKDIGDYCTSAKHYKLPLRTFEHYYSRVMDEQSDLMVKERKRILVAYNQRITERIKQAGLKYTSSGELKALEVQHKFEEDYITRLQSLGILDTSAEKVELTIQEKLLSAIDKARELTEKTKKK